MSGVSIWSLHGCEDRAGSSSPATPNVIYVFPSQFRNPAMGFWSQEDFREQVHFRGDPVHTPSLDRFARESLVLTSAMSNCPLSSPHRGMLMSGMYPHRNGVPLNCNSTRPVSTLRTDIECISDLFAGAGYECAYFGKYHLDFPTPNDPQHPRHYVERQQPVQDAYTPPERRHSFHHWYSYGIYDHHKTPHYWDTQGKRHQVEEWSPLHEADQVVTFLKNRKKTRDPKKPFFVMVGMNPPHTPYSSLKDCMEEDYEWYKGRTPEELLVRPNADTSLGKAARTGFYFAAVTGVDRAFGQILDALEELGLTKNTIVVFSSDHGDTMCSQGLVEPSNSPSRESMNIPFLVRYPAKLKPRVDHTLLSTPDVMPTLAGLAGLTDFLPESVQGIDLSAIFYDENADSISPAGVLYFQNIDGEKDGHGLIKSYIPIARGWKTHRYTLALYIDRKTRKLVRSLLFDDLKDPYQQHNLSLSQHKEIVEELCRQMGQKLKEIEDPWYTERILGEMIRYE